MSSAVELDGSHGEGGGQILRSALALSMITGRPLTLKNIRARRSQPGLRPQHLMCVHASRTISNAAVTGAAVGSRELDFVPGAVTAGDYVFDIPTAGCTALVLHTIYLPLMRLDASSTLSLGGGTHVKMAPCFEYLTNAWAPQLRASGAALTVELDRHGFYPRGGGRIRAALNPWPDVRPQKLLERGSVKGITPISLAMGLPAHVATRQAERADHQLRKQGFRKILKRPTLQCQSPGGPGSMLGLHLRAEGIETFFFALGERGKTAERVAEEAVGELADYVKAGDFPVDPHAADQLLLPLVFASGPSEFRTSRVTQHLLTNADVVIRFVDASIEIDGELGRPATVKITV